MKKIRIIVAHNERDPSDDLRIASRIRQALWAHSPVEIGPDSRMHGTHRDNARNAYFEFATNYPQEVERILEERKYNGRVTMQVVADGVGPECVNCGNMVGPILPAICPNCHFREIANCPYCNQEVARQAYLPVSGDLFRCPMCQRRVRLCLHDPIFNSQGEYNQPLIVVEKAME